MGVLLMAMTIGGVLVAGILLAISIITRTTWLRNFVLGGVAVWFLFYFAMLFSFSLTSEEKELAINEPKEFCGFYLDCHMHTSVTGVRKTKTIGNKIANGEFYVVTVNVSSNAVKVDLGLDGVDAHVVDSDGEKYDRDIDAESELDLQPEFSKRIAPEESFRKKIVFDLPPNIRNPRLDISEGAGIDRFLETFLVSDEDSIFHNRIYFRLEPRVETAGAPAL